MGLIECIVVDALRRLGRVSLDRLAKIVFLVDRLGGFEAFNWDRIDLVLTSPEFISVIERLVKSGVVKTMGDFVIPIDNDYDPGCGWLENSVKSTINYVVSKYGGLSDGELDDVVDSIMEGVY
ncbi:hypothetical protein [Vulcanisaeta distributa]|uniref:Uncharacterized protein n=1 Tax=Vulcanisaeta distributa (strain DSM 14429 / JCM 11212 / NBRC 100878 / IC-017) TaxID=572478 RepID=E1QRI8_VULDI|nr:hypothetical protein [Vulcanisaeta distributa]ADN51802.1 conserved hypothetical protein [Vulcanisaeta distributa DSM 14429]